MLRLALLALTLASLTLACSSGGKCDPVLDCSPPVPGCDCSAAQNDAGTEADAGTETDADGGFTDGSDAGENPAICGITGEIDLTGTWTGGIQLAGGTEAITLVLTENSGAYTVHLDRDEPTCGDLEVAATLNVCSLAGDGGWTLSAESQMRIVATLDGTTLTGSIEAVGTPGTTCEPFEGSFTVARAQ